MTTKAGHYSPQDAPRRQHRRRRLGWNQGAPRRSAPSAASVSVGGGPGRRGRDECQRAPRANLLLGLTRVVYLVGSSCLWLRLRTSFQVSQLPDKVMLVRWSEFWD